MWAFSGRCGVLSVLSATLLIASVPARASDLENVEALIRQGVELRHQGRDVQALPLFQKAYGLARTPRAAGQLGLCEMAMGYWLDAESHLAEAISFPEHPWVKRNLTDLTGAVASVRKNIGEVVVEGGPSGAEVLVNGRPAGRLPLSAPLRLGKGVADVEVRAPGHLAATRSLRITGSDVERLSIVLDKAPPAAQAQALPIAAPPAGAADTAGAAGASVDPPTDRQGGETSRTNPRRIAAWTVTGAAALALGLGVVETFSWLKKQDAFDNHRSPASTDPAAPLLRDCGTGEINYGGPACKSLHDDLAGARLLTIVGYGLAGALGVTAAVLFATSTDDRAGTSTALVCAPDLVGRGVGCRIIF